MGGMGGMIPMAIIREMSNGNQPTQTGQHADRPPVRTLLAKQYLEYLTEKQEKRPVPSAITEGRQEFDIMDGQKPTMEEEAAGVAAANVLEQYFLGKLEPNIWEKEDLVLAPTVSIPCVCTGVNGIANNRCWFCGGSGKATMVLDPSKIQQEPLAAKLERVPHPEMDNTKPPAPRRRPTGPV
jgi:hypothetical protein